MPTDKHTDAYHDYVKIVHELEELACRNSLEVESRQRVLLAVQVLRNTKLVQPDIHIHVHIDQSFLQPLTTRLDAIMTSQAELKASLDAADAKLEKAFTELRGLVDTLTQQVADLTAAVANAPVSPELQATADAVAATAQKLDDIVPDAPTP